MGKRHHRNRSSSRGTSVLTARPPIASPGLERTRKPRAAALSRALPLAQYYEPLVIRQAPPPVPAVKVPEVGNRPVGEQAEEHLRPLPRSRSLALSRPSLAARVTAWCKAMLGHKRPNSIRRKEVELTRKQLKDLRRQISVMERLLGGIG